jgi:hypothetical protein
MVMGIKYFCHSFRPLDYILVLISKLEPGSLVNAVATRNNSRCILK